MPVADKFVKLTVAGYPRVIWPFDPMNNGCEEVGRAAGRIIEYELDCMLLFVSVVENPLEVAVSDPPVTVAAERDPDSTTLVRFNVLGKPVVEVPLLFTNSG